MLPLKYHYWNSVDLRRTKIKVNPERPDTGYHPTVQAAVDGEWDWYDNQKWWEVVEIRIYLKGKANMMCWRTEYEVNCSTIKGFVVWATGKLWCHLLRWGSLGGAGLRAEMEYNFNYIKFVIPLVIQGKISGRHLLESESQRRKSGLEISIWTSSAYSWY